MIKTEYYGENGLGSKLYRTYSDEKKYIKQVETNIVYSEAIDVADESNYTLHFDGENKVAYLGDCSNIETRMLYLSGILDKEKDKRSAKPARHKYGEYNNVLLSDEDIEKLKAEFPADWQQRIERLSGYIASTGKSYKNHLATIRNWAKRDKEKGAAEKKQKNGGWCMPNADDDIDLTKIFG